jgi:hypothetical protein
VARENPDHGGEIAQLSLSVYLELMTILGAYREALVLVGGWAPYFILERFGREDTDFRHVGSIDIDVAVNPRLVSPDEYASIVERLERRGYRQRLNRLGQPIPFVFEREVSLGEERDAHIIEIDFLAPEYGGTGKSHRHQRVQHDLLARKARGSDVVFDHCFDYELTGVLPDGAENAVHVKIADVVGCLREGIDTIAEKFESIRSVGPVGVGRFLGSDSAERERITADAFISVSEFIGALEECPDTKPRPG